MIVCLIMCISGPQRKKPLNNTIMEIQYRKDLVKLLTEMDILGDVAEIGVAEGRFSKVLLESGIPKLYMVDIWTSIPDMKGDVTSPQEWHDRNYKEAQERVASFGDKATLLKGFSNAMATQIPDESLSLLYIDAGHDYASVMQDLQIWFPKVKPGCIIAGHDYLNPAYGVGQAVQDFCKDRFDIHVIPEDHPDDAGFWFIKQ